MKIRSALFAILSIVLPVTCKAQDLNSRILMTVGGSRIEAGEFIRMYRKSLEPGKPLPVDDYIGQFISFKLKVADAMHEGDDTTMSFRKELNGYRNQLALNYLTDTLVRDRLLRKAYQRSLTEINAWHILIALPGNASASDTLRAWKKANDIRERILKGEPFEQVARGCSDDQSVKMNGGNLGYFTVFQTIMPFEDAAYSLKKGEISKPVRTAYGYHIIKVADIRPSKGKIQVAHIMKNAPPGASEEDAAEAEAEIRRIYQKLKEGIPFGDLAVKYSDHKESAARGGVLNWFGAGEMTPEFSEAAFALTDTGDFTKPFRTTYGWHIVKLLNRRPAGTFEESGSWLESRINKSYLNTLSKQSFTERLKKEYNFRINENSYNWFVRNTDTLIIQGLKKYDRSSMPDANTFSFADQALKNSEFADFIERRGTMIVTRDSCQFINILLDASASDKITGYENSILERKYPEFRYLMNEFHDGILLFDISLRKVWDRVNRDTAGLLKYYEDHKSAYLSAAQISAKIYTLRLPGGEKALSKAFKKYSGKADTDDRLLSKFNNENDTLLIIKEGTWKRGDDPAIDDIPWHTGSVLRVINGFPSIIVVKNVREPLPLPFHEVQDKMLEGYQDFLDNEWVRQLKDKYIVKIDTFVLEEVKKKLINE